MIGLWGLLRGRLDNADDDTDEDGWEVVRFSITIIMTTKRTTLMMIGH